MSFNCTTPSYERIYAPWLANPGKLLDLAEYKRGDILLDLAGGPGTVSKEAILRGAGTTLSNTTVHLLDPNPDRGFRTPVIRRKTGYAENVEDYYSEDFFDIVICRQAIGYINMIYAIPGIHKVLKPGGRFVFNSFITPKPYGIKKITTEDGTRFFEAHIRWFHYILHMQVRLNNGWGIDFSVFSYWKLKFLHDLLTPWFKTVDVYQKGKSIHWVCTKENK